MISIVFSFVLGCSTEGKIIPIEGTTARIDEKYVLEEEE